MGYSVGMTIILCTPEKHWIKTSAPYREMPFITLSYIYNGTQILHTFYTGIDTCD